MSTISTTAATGGESFADLFAESIKNQDMKSGEVISAEVVRIDHNFVVVNAGGRVTVTADEVCAGELKEYLCIYGFAG